MDHLLSFFVLLIVSLFATFRVAEMKAQHSFWADIIGFVAISIGGFWMALIHVLMWQTPGYAPVSDDFSAMIFYIGVALVTWSATCHRLRRRANDPKPEPQDDIDMDEDEFTPKMAAAQYRRRSGR